MSASRLAITALAVTLTVLIGPVAAGPPVGWAQADEPAGLEDGASEDSDETAADEKSNDDEIEVKRSRTMGLDNYDARLERPVGWVRAEPGAGAALTLRAAGNDRAQIEIRISSPVPEERRDSFFSAFDSQLEAAGFKQVSLRENVRFAGRPGRWTEYTGSTDRGSFRLVVWQMYHKETAWIAVGFFPQARVDGYTEDFEALLDSLTFR